ncbi:endogenous retrovirus group K member 8 Gag polyprotein-like [Crotalus tigris]|uniref:endogenous retrovirus group K member 8 Gag polyprotein-like n=1 Tax=Crotalus tigris TaxID=88082 RepID=UPI00192F7176|nr:endogenous retrovirus group K member 8 Gag polyprotein-like [Crotalus tigris]
MGAEFSKPQVAHLHELRELTKTRLNGGKNLAVPTKSDLISLLKYIYQQCPAYPEEGSLKESVWIKLGTYFHESPRAPPKILTTWRIVMEYLKIHKNTMVGASDPPPPYQSGIQNPPQIEPVTVAQVEATAPAQTAPKTSETPAGAIAQALARAKLSGDLELDEYEMCYPVEFDTNGAPYIEPVPMKLIRDIKQAVNTYGIQNSYVIGLISNLANSFYMLPSDWKNLCRMILTSSQFVVWESEYKREAEAIVRRIGGNLQLEQLIGEGRYASPNIQKNMSRAAFAHSSLAAQNAFSKIDDPGSSAAGSFAKIYQGSSQSYGDFIDQLQKAVFREIRNPIAQKELIKKLAYENANEDCRRIIQPLLSKPDAELADYIQACRIVGTNVHNMETLAMALQNIKGETFKNGNCFNCGKPGHFRAQCRAPGGGAHQSNSNQNKPKTVCPRCKKGYHWASLCRVNPPPQSANNNNQNQGN